MLTTEGAKRGLSKHRLAKFKYQKKNRNQIKELIQDTIIQVKRNVDTLCVRLSYNIN